MKIYIGKSKLHGKGIFAKKNIKKGEIIFIIKGKKVDFLINSKQKAKIAGLNWVGIGKNEWIDPQKHCVYFNHSCEPNSAIKGKVTVVALRDIPKNGEVTFDYSFNEADIFWHIKCNCGSQNCRKIIRSIQFLPTKTYFKHISHIPKYYQTIYKKFNIAKFKNSKEFEAKWVNFIKKDS